MEWLEKVPNWTFYICYLLGFLWLGLIEAFGLFRVAKGDTISELLYLFLRGGPARYIVLGGLFIWFTIHIFFKGRFG